MTKSVKLFGYAVTVVLLLTAACTYAEGTAEPTMVVLADQDRFEIRMLAMDVSGEKDLKGREKAAIKYGVYLNDELILIVWKETLLYKTSQGIDYDRIVRAASREMSRGFSELAKYLYKLEDVK